MYFCGCLRKRNRGWKKKFCFDSLAKRYELRKKIRVLDENIRIVKKNGGNYESEVRSFKRIFKNHEPLSACIYLVTVGYADKGSKGRF
jgi:hypothetical protein